MDIIKQLGGATLHLRLKRLSDRLSQDLLKKYRELGLNVEPSWLPILFLLEKQNYSVQGIASSLGISHPAVVQFVKQMEKRNLVVSEQDSTDKRKKIICLTDTAKETVERIIPVQKEIEETIEKLEDETNTELDAVLDKIETSLSKRSFYRRINDSYKEKAIKEVEILSYNSKLKDYFKDLNYTWIQKYFEIEPEDEKILGDPEGEIINKGGEIFFARIKDEIIGTCAAIKTDRETYELAKMAVAEKAQGKQAGKKLALAVIGFAWSKKAKYVTLETSSKLVAAVNLYKSLGFQTVIEKSESKYKRKVFKMMLEL